MPDGEEALVRESTIPIVSGAGPYQSSVRSARFLLPRADGARLPALPFPPGDPGPVLGGGLKAEFKGWAGSPGLWRRWVAKIRPRHEPLWREVGILDAILSTTYRVRRDEAALLQLAAFWSGSTNTFVFPWGEATVTLEDVAVLAGLPLVGCPVREGLWDELEKEVGALEAVRSVLNRSTKKKPSYGAWVKHFLERALDKEASAGDGGDRESRELVEHGAFLSMWLSLFVFAAPPFNVVRREVFPIAVRLARGQSMAVAPAALASIYNDLSMLKWHFSASKKMEPFGISAPMHILQLWVWERFPELRPEMASTPDHREVPRAARWHDVFKELNPKYVHAVFISPKEFEWRPYGSSKFSLPSETGACWVHGQDIAGNKELLSFARCLHSCELVGMDCIEKYRPHRVARQLGFDQDVPGTVARVNSKWKKAWDTYNIEAESSAFIVPIHKPGVTVEYVQWWEPYSLACASVVANAAKMKRLRIYVSPMKRKIEGLPAANSSKKLHVDTATRMPQPAPDVAEDPLDDIPLVERLNRIIKMMPKQQKTDCLVKSAEKEQIAENANCFIPRSANVGIKKAVLHRNVEQDLSDVATGSASIVMELSCGTVATKTQGNDMDIQVLREVAVLRNHDNVVVVSDDEFDEATGKEDAIFEEETLDEDFTVTMHLKSPKMETKGSILLDSNEERQLVSKINDELDNPMLKDIMVQSIQDCEVAAVVNEEIDNRDKVHREDSVEVNIKKAGNRERSSSRLVDGITEVDTSVICTKTLYYLSPLDLVKKDQGKDANNSGIDQDVYLPKRAVGTMEMIKRVSAIRQAEIAELKEKIDNLKEEIRVLEAAE